MDKKKYSGIIVGTFSNLVMIVFSLSCIFPIAWMLSSSLKMKREFNADIIGLPENPKMTNYIRILSNPDYHILQSLLNSIRTTFISVAFIVVLGFVLGYFLARVNFRGKKLIWLLLLLGMLIPVHSLLVPIYVVFSNAGLSNQWYTLILPYVALGLPISVFLTRGYLKDLPMEMEEAAAIDGCGFSKTMFRIIMPICRPILVTVAIVQAFDSWNEFSFALVLLKDAKLHTVPLAMTQFTGQFTSDYPKIMAAMLITMAPIIILYFLFSRRIIEGMVSGAVKG